MLFCARKNVIRALFYFYHKAYANIKLGRKSLREYLSWLEVREKHK